MTLFEVLGTISVVIGIAFIIIGIYGLYTHKNFYARAALASLIDSCGFLFVITGVILYKGLSTFSLKVFFIYVLVLLLNPLANHYIVRGAHNSGHRPGKEY